MILLSPYLFLSWLPMILFSPGLFLSWLPVILLSPYLFLSWHVPTWQQLLLYTHACTCFWWLYILCWVRGLLLTLPHLLPFRITSFPDGPVTPSTGETMATVSKIHLVSKIHPPGARPCLVLSGSKCSVPLTSICVVVSTLLFLVQSRILSTGLKHMGGGDFKSCGLLS